MDCLIYRPSLRRTIAKTLIGWCLLQAEGKARTDSTTHQSTLHYRDCGRSHPKRRLRLSQQIHVYPALRTCVERLLADARQRQRALELDRELLELPKRLIKGLSAREHRQLLVLVVALRA